MKKGYFKRIVLIATLLSLLTFSAGCVEALVGGGVATFGLGYLLGSTTAPTVVQQQCFVNGVETDCASLP